MSDATTAPKFVNLTVSSPPSAPDVYIIQMNKPPENRLTTAFAQEIISALRYIERTLQSVGSGPSSAGTGAGAVIISSFSAKFWCTGLDLDEGDTNPHANTDGFYPLLATLLDYPFPTVALMTGHTFGGACPLALACDYRVMNSRRGFLSMPPVNLGLWFDGIGALPRLKLRPQVARKMLLEAHRWTGPEAVADGIVDAVADPDEMEAVAVALAQAQKEKSRMGVYALLRHELWGDALEKFRRISYVHGRATGTAPKAKI